MRRTFATLILLVGMLVVSCTQKSRVYHFSGGSVSFDLPKGWREAPSDGTAISFSSPSKEAALTVTVHANPILAPDDIDRVATEKQPFGIPITAKRKLSVQNGTGYVQEYRNQTNGSDVYWISHFLFFEHATVISSVNGPVSELQQNRVVFEQILGSIRMHSARR